MSNWKTLLEGMQRQTLSLAGGTTSLVIERVDLPVFNLDEMEPYLSQYRTVSGSPIALKFIGCKVHKMLLNFPKFHLVFEDCQFVDVVDIKSDFVIQVVSKKEPVTFSSEVTFSGTSSKRSQLDLRGVTFLKKVTLKNYSMNEEDAYQEGIKSQFKGVTFEQELILSNVVFPLNVVLESVVWPKTIQAKRDVFRQLKRVMAHQHNFIQSTIFHSYEMREYEKELAKEGWLGHFEDKLLFAFNKYASNFSLSWFRPFLWIVGLSLVFYAAAWCIQPNSISFNGFFEFLNPFSWNAKKQFEGVYWLWFLHKLVVVPLVYLMIVALKRKTKL